MGKGLEDKGKGRLRACSISSPVQSYFHQWLRQCAVIYLLPRSDWRYSVLLHKLVSLFSSVTGSPRWLYR